MKKLSLLILVLLAGALLYADSVVEEIIAKVNADIITRSEYTRSRQALIEELKQQSPTEWEKLLAEREKDVLRDLIDQELLFQKGLELGYTADTEVIKRLDEMRKGMNLQSMEDLERAATAQGVNFEDYKDGMRKQIVTQMVIQREVGGTLKISDEEIKKLYEEKKHEMEQPEQVRLSEILIAPKGAEGATPTPEDSERAKQKALDILAQLKQGSKFEELARKQSNGPSAPQGGDLGNFKRGVLAKELEDKVFALKTGEYTEVIETRQGFVILKVAEHIAAGVPPLKDVEGRIQESIYFQKLQPALRVYLTKLREESSIDIKAGYVDSAASPNQTKPIVVAESGDQSSGTTPRQKRKKK